MIIVQCFSQELYYCPCVRGGWTYNCPVCVWRCIWVTRMKMFNYIEIMARLPEEYWYFYGYFTFFRYSMEKERYMGGEKCVGVWRMENRYKIRIWANVTVSGLCIVFWDSEDLQFFSLSLWAYIICFKISIVKFKHLSKP